MPRSVLKNFKKRKSTLPGRSKQEVKLDSPRPNNENQLEDSPSPRPGPSMEASPSTSTTRVSSLLLKRRLVLI